MSVDADPPHAIDPETGESIIAPGTHESLANPAYTREPFVEFDKVGPDTDLTTLNLNWRERDLPERERTKHVHRLHPYLGKYIPQIVEIFLRKFRPRLVCDPFVGSGTTLVEAIALGIDCFGVDIAPFNCLLSKVKTDVYDLGLLSYELYDILDRACGAEHSLFSTGSQPSARNLCPTDYIQKWFAPRAQRELLTYCALIPEYKYADVMKIILSRAARSARLVPHHELDFPTVPQRAPYWCRKHHRICYPTNQAQKFLQRYTKDTLRRITQFAEIRRKAKVTIVNGDSREIDFPPADLLITSPPYVGLIDYHDQHRYAYEFLSLLPNPFGSIGQQYRATQQLEIGPARKGRSRVAQEQYREDIHKALFHAIEPMPSGSHIVIVINDKHGIYPAIADSLPVEQVAVLNRHVNRRTGRRAGAFYEQILIWRKTT